MQPVIKHLPPIEFKDETSGIANLNAQIGRRLPPMVNDFTVFFIGFALGALAFALAVIFALNQNPK